jgi:Cu/Ag efflux pump CusA
VNENSVYVFDHQLSDERLFTILAYRIVFSFFAAISMTLLLMPVSGCYYYEDRLLAFTGT